MMRRSSLVILLYAALATLVIPVFPHLVSPNEFTRWALAAALIEEGTVEVTRIAPILGPRFEDFAEIEGRFYSNKAPGAAMVSLPGYLMARTFVGPPSRESMRASLTVMRIAGATLPTLLLAFLFQRMARKLEVSEERESFVVAALLFATPLFAYGLLLFAHALVAACLFAAWALLFFFDEERSAARREFAAGAAVGLAVMSEYTAALPAAVLLCVYISRRRLGGLMRVLLGGVPFAILLSIYHKLAFGGFFRLSYSYDKLPSFRELSKVGVFGISFPSPGTLMKLLFDPSKGLLIFSPILILLIFKLPAVRQRLTTRGFLALFAAPTSLIILYSGYPNWHGGWNLGPRYIVPAIPFLLVPLLFGERPGRIESLFFGGSIVAVCLTALVFPLVPNAFDWPWGTLAMPLMSRGLVAPNLFHFVGTIAAVAVPFALVAAASVVATRKRFGYALAGMIVFLLVGFAASRPPSLNMTLQRGYIEEVYFGRAGSLEQSIAPLPLPPGLVARRSLELTLPPPMWPF